MTTTVGRIDHLARSIGAIVLLCAAFAAFVGNLIIAEQPESCSSSDVGVSNHGRELRAEQNSLSTSPIPPAYSCTA